MYLVGGYILTPDQVRQWCLAHEIEDPTPASATILVNRWLREHSIPTRLLAVTFRKESMYLIVTTRRSDPIATQISFKPFEENDRARQVKSQLDVGDVEFVTVHGY
ncbi:hypothetical protein AMATHDRAFT_48359 [Amanita thiersii Skay4041]|uniref:Uncharacterized protein n=1 Tax=Amanita thiersii Skay4041 TaxID=703135 RepID=A0A2A9NQB8_9AGAR|nr:hypothetical protein AMATHDRAFT_48359 [Amanita thiersii Skay4041]